MTPIPTHDLSAHRHAEGQTPQWTRPPPDPPHPWHIGLPVSGSRCGHAHPRGPAAAAAHCHRSGRVPTGRDRGGGAPDGDVCATVSWLFGGPGRHRRRRLARAGPGRDGQVHPAVPGPHRYLHRHPRGGEPARREYDAAVTRPLLEACVAICESCGDECERHSRLRAFGRYGHVRPAQKPTRRMRWITRAVLQPTSAAGALPGHFGADPLRRIDQDNLRVATPPWRHG
jgi:hypothetical protein